MAGGAGLTAAARDLADRFAGRRLLGERALAGDHGPRPAHKRIEAMWRAVVEATLESHSTTSSGLTPASFGASTSALSAVGYGASARTPIQTLLEPGLIDEFRLRIFPLVLTTGKAPG